MTHASHNATNSHTTNEESTMSTNDPTTKHDAFVRAAHDYYMDHTKKTFEELRKASYQRSDWGDGLTGDEWADVDDAAEAGADAAQQYLESERLTADQVITRAGLRPDATYIHTDTGSVMTGREWAEQIREADREADSAFDPVGGEAHLVEATYRVANEFPALGDAAATYHATEANATEAAAALVASLTDDVMAWGELTPVAPTGDAAEVAAMREAYDLAASASDDAINNAGIVCMTREAAELIAARAVSITRVNAQQPHRYRNYNTRGGIVMEIGQLEKTATLFNTCFDVGSHVVYYPSRHEDDIIIHRNGKRSYTKTKAFVRENTVVVFLEGIGNCDVRNVVSGATCSLDDVGFDKTFNHLW